MACENKIKKNILSTCETQTIGGIEQVVYLINRTDIASIDYHTGMTSLITNITLTNTATTTAYKLTGLKKSLNYKSDRVVAEDQADRFKHTFSFYGFEFDSASIENMDSMNDLVVIVERKDKYNADGIFVALGVNTGLFITTDTSATNDSNGVRKIEMATLDGQLERYSQNNVLKVDYAQTKSMLEGLL